GVGKCVQRRDQRLVGYATANTQWLADVLGVRDDLTQHGRDGGRRMIGRGGGRTQSRDQYAGREGAVALHVDLGHHVETKEAGGEARKKVRGRLLRAGQHVARGLSYVPALTQGVVFPLFGFERRECVGQSSALRVN